MLWLKLFVFLASLTPAIVFSGLAVAGAYSPDPGQALIIRFAHTATIFLLITLSLKPIATLKGLRPVIRFSRMAGLFCFFYALLHFLAYLAFKTGFMWSLFEMDLAKRPYVYVGMAAFVILALMAVTSTKWWQRRLKRNWKMLHRLVYLALILIIIHILWVARSDVWWTVIYGTIGTLLLAWRARLHWLKRRNIAAENHPS
ncbi:Protein-methionine-sulfoxide reductase heme-binding subunit MsrQ [BD1-7 clade bacterium]|uniref:Protein-methionine-sulfoxide reductase heme-binding subunit MsrQ n=1 Tax=BD1-7 clade bacterium TaxID=2029982 RepID=A0A5S9PY44_9GAMM|nr:Protein-methionine-sulfoxide reductase heme-binding subunit MsrQ [BD1-7 clade bacterium]CAA0109380.1 Protein-methionine-sulfoxide reductase heme-binding subunit MsrQ [BD1-7 clade bacterium]